LPWVKVEASATLLAQGKSPSVRSSAGRLEVEWWEAAL